MAPVNSKQQSRYQQEAGQFLAVMDEMAPQICLDYSKESLQRLDHFISEHFEPWDKQHSNQNLPYQVGCYLGEVIIRNLGGAWNTDDQPEINHIGSIEVFLPLEKALNRFEKGRQASLAWVYYTLSKDLYEANQPATSSKLTDWVGGEPAESLLAFFKGLFK